MLALRTDLVSHMVHSRLLHELELLEHVVRQGVRQRRVERCLFTRGCGPTAALTIEDGRAKVRAVAFACAWAWLGRGRGGGGTIMGGSAPAR